LPPAWRSRPRGPGGATLAGAVSPLSAGPQGGRPSDDDVVTRTAWWLALGDPQKLLSWEAARIGSPDRLNGSGMNGPGVYNEFFELPAVPGLFDQRELTVSATPAGHGQTAIRVDAMVDWIPARAPGDTVPATARVAVLTETKDTNVHGKPLVVVTATLTDAKQVAALAAYLNGLPVNPPGGVYSCPAAIGGGRIAVSFRERTDGPASPGPSRPLRAARSSASRSRASRRPGSAARPPGTTSSLRSTGSRACTGRSRRARRSGGPARGGRRAGKSLDLPVAGRCTVVGVSESAELYTIGQAARRVGVPARTIRFWCDSGVLPTAMRSAGGYRRYDAAAIARLALVRTLRDLGLGLDDIRAVLGDSKSVAELASVHASALDAQIRVLRVRRAVLRVLAARRSDIEEVKQLNDLARLSAQERQQIIDEFVDRTFAGTGPDDPAMNIARGMRALPAELPDDPAPEQVDAWIELAGLVADEDFGRRAREMVFAGGTAQQLPEGIDYRAVTEQLERAVADGVDPASAAGRAILEHVVPPGTPGPERERLLAQLETFTDERVERYWQLVGILNGRAPFAPRVPAFRWLIAALRAHG
jgi:DNA-binding transcriptional MerR regulator